MANMSTLMGVMFRYSRTRWLPSRESLTCPLTVEARVSNTLIRTGWHLLDQSRESR